MIQRRQFIKMTGAAAAGFGMIPKAALAHAYPEVMTAKDLNAYLRSLVQVPEPSVDRVIVGDPETVIMKIGTAWMPYWQTLKEALRQGVNTLVVHEPTFYTHRDLDETNGSYFSAPAPAREMYLEQVASKKSWIEQNGMVIIRCHDVLDKIKGFGIPFAFGRALGFQDSQIVRSRTYYNVYSIDPQPAIEVARMIAGKLLPAGQPGVAFYGDPTYRVSTVGVGTGVNCDPLEYMDLGMDLAVAIDDTVRTWIQTTFSEDSGRPLVVVNHGTTEEYGMAVLADHLRNTLESHEVLHFKQGCSYRWVNA